MSLCLLYVEQLIVAYCPTATYCTNDLISYFKMTTSNPMSVSQEKRLAYSVSSPSGALLTQAPKIIRNISREKILRFKALRSQLCFSVLQKPYVTNYSSGLTWPHSLNHKYTNQNPSVSDSETDTVKPCKLFYKCDLYVTAFLK